MGIAIQFSLKCTGNNINIVVMFGYIAKYNVNGYYIEA